MRYYDDEEKKTKAEKIADFCNEIIDISVERDMYTSELYEALVNAMGCLLRDDLDEEDLREFVRDIHSMLTQIVENMRRKNLNEHM